MLFTNKNNPAASPTFTDCPDDVLRHVFAQLRTPQDVDNLGKTCKQFRRLAQAPDVLQTHRINLTNDILKRSSVPPAMLHALSTPKLQRHWYAQQAAAANLGVHSATEVARIDLSQRLYVTSRAISPCDRFIGVASDLTDGTTGNGWALFQREAATLREIAYENDDFYCDIAFSPCSKFIALMGAEHIALQPVDPPQNRQAQLRHAMPPLNDRHDAQCTRLYFTENGHHLAAYRQLRNNTQQLFVWQNWSSATACTRIVTHTYEDNLLGLMFFESHQGKQLNFLSKNSRENKERVLSWALPSGKAVYNYMPAPAQSLRYTDRHATVNKFGANLWLNFNSCVSLSLDSQPDKDLAVYDFKEEGVPELAAFSQCGTYVLCFLNAKKMILLNLVQPDLSRF